MNLNQFHQEIEKVWQQIEEKIDDEGLSVDTEIQGAVCTLTFDDDSQSKLGGFHFKFIDNEWKTAEGRSFWQHLEEAFARHGETISF